MGLPLVEILLGAVCLVVGLGLVLYLAGRRPGSGGGSGCWPWMLPILGAGFLVKGGYDLMVALFD